MTISNTKAKSVYETNGERRQWEIGFDFDSNVSNLNIILEDSEGYQTVVEDNYLIEDGVVIYPSLESELDPIAEGYKIILFRSTPNTQEIDLRDNVTEKGLDKLTLQVQELSEQVDRAVKVPLVEEGVNEYQDLVLKVREERDSALEQIEEATSVVSDYTQASALNAVTSKEEADRAVEASNTSVMASADAEASAIEAANLANEAKDAVSAYVNGLGAMRNAVLDLGVFEDNQRRDSSCIIDFDFEPLDVFVRFSDSEKKMWIKGSYSFAGIEKVEDRKYKIFYSVSPEDFASQNAIKGPFYVQYVIKYSIFSGKPVVYRGRVDSVDKLPETAEDGDLWYVGPVEQDNKEEYVWQGGKWELVGSTSREDYETLHNDLDELGDQVAEIESKIPEGTSDTNPLINKQQLLDKEMDMRSDFNESVSELQTQITAQASAIANKVDVTGDTMTGTLNLPELNVATSEGTLNLSITAGVATIATNNGLDIVSQTKFDTSPTTDDSTTWAEALDTSLVRKAQVATAIAEASGGGASVPDNVYTQENLLGGKDIEIVPEPVEGGIDENTLACWHFDTDNTDVVNGISLGSSVETSFSKFGPGCSPGGGYQSFINLPFGFSSTQDFSFDLWYFRYASNGDGEIGFKDGRGFYYTMWFAINYMGQVQCVHNSTRSEVVATIPQGEWAHLYAHHKAETNTYEYFVDGIKVYSVVDATSFGDRNQFSIASYYVAYKDEVRISNCIRWTEDFTPPTQPYRLAVPTGNFMINFTGEAGQSGKNIGEVYYSQSSLASDNAGALPLFTGETIASADTIYPDFYAWVESHTELQTTAEEYETALSTYGECPKYVVSDGSLRLPKLSLLNRRLVEKKEATETDPAWYNLYSDGYLEQGGKIERTTTGQTTTIELVKPFANTNYTVLASTKPDDSDSISGRIYTVSKNLTTTSFNVTNNGWTGEYNGITGFWEAKGYVGTNSSENNFPWVFAYNASVPASTAQAAEFQNAISGKADTNLGNIPTNYDYVVESKSPTADDPTWYRVYKSGWVEQGGLAATGESTAYVINLPKPFENAEYNVTVICMSTGDTQNGWGYAHGRTTTLFKIVKTAAKAVWSACGQGAEL